MRKYKREQTEKRNKSFATIATLGVGIILSSSCKQQNGQEKNEVQIIHEIDQIRETNLKQLDTYRALYSIVLEIPFAQDRLAKNELLAKLNEVEMDQGSSSGSILVEIEDLRRILDSSGEAPPMQLAFIRERFHQKSKEIRRTLAFLNSLTDSASY